MTKFSSSSSFFFCRKMPLKNSQKLPKKFRSLVNSDAFLWPNINDYTFSFTLITFGGPCTGGSNIPISRFQNVNILYLPRQRRQKRIIVVKPMSQYPNFNEPNILISHFQWVLSNIQISNQQYPLLFGNIQYPVLRGAGPYLASSETIRSSIFFIIF